jgi:hypothetical protein
MNIVKEFSGMDTKTVIEFWWQQLGNQEPVKDDYNIFLKCIGKNISIGQKEIDGDGFWIKLTKKNWKYSMSLYFCTLEGKVDCCRLRK